MVLIPRTSPSVSFGSRGPEVSLNKEETPGPGHYTGHSPASALFNKGGDGFGFGTSTRRCVDAGGPGPGTYVRKDFGRGMKITAPTYTCAPKVAIPEYPQDVPGPGTYGGIGGVVDNSSPRYSFRGSCKVKDASGEQPGPGLYSPGLERADVIVQKREKAPGFTTFGSESKWSAAISRKQPGPGQYSPISSSMKGACTRISPRPHPPPRQLEEISPGPGAFDQISSFPTPRKNKRRPPRQGS
eukprot:TRINITY_DN65157_c0_g1_i1.p1 TRINITY_DN65157_c0_g1~~TRINITY_DN65157_c0_g1_i1.p1  ORF type:complete len:265 (-),score=38.74 TRINITY_DN65157_c0_g1_i1:75-800(-)